MLPATAASEALQEEKHYMLPATSASETSQEEKHPMLTVTSASPPRDEPARASSGKVRQVAKATNGQRQNPAEPTGPNRGPTLLGPTSPKRGHKASGGKRKVSSSESDTPKSLRDEIQEGFQNLGRDLRRLTPEVGKAGNRWPGKPPPGGLKQRTSRGDPRFWLIIFRVGPYVNTYACTAVLFHFWALWGDTPARTGLHHRQPTCSLEAASPRGEIKGETLHMHYPCKT